MIKTITINGDGKEITRTWTTFEQFEKEWNGNSWDGPALEDKVISASVDGIEVKAETFKDVMDFIEIRFDFKYY